MSTNPSSNVQKIAPTKLIALDLIDESPTNPRKDFGDIGELAASIRERGLLQNIVVRPVKDRFEIVFGHRRFRAAKEAGLDEIPAAIRDMEDVEVLQEQLIENAQRKDVHPLEEADAYKRLHVPPPEGYGLTGEEIAERVGKHKATVFARMKLAELVDKDLRAAFLANTLTASAALLVARLPAEKQKEISKIVLTGGEDHDWNPCPMTVLQLADFLEEDHGLKSKENDQVGELEDLNAKKKAAVAEVKAAEKALKEKQAKVTKTTEAVKQATTAAVAKKDPLAGKVEALVDQAEAKLYKSITDAIDAKAKANPATDAKLVRLLSVCVLASGECFERMETVAESYGLKGIGVGDERLDQILSKLPADKLRAVAARGVAESMIGADYSEGVSWDGIRGQRIHYGLRIVAEAFGVDWKSIEKTAKQDHDAAVKALREGAKDGEWVCKKGCGKPWGDHAGQKCPPVQTSAKEAARGKKEMPNPFKAATASARKTLAKSKASSSRAAKGKAKK